MADQGFSDLLASRKHSFLARREAQLHLNRMAVLGGRDYVARRLWRAPNESDLSWFGHRTSDASTLTPNITTDGMVGRRERTTYVNHAGRVVSKIQQYLFKQPAERDGADDEALSRIGGEGVDILTFWMDVSEMLTYGQWVWIQTSRDVLPDNLADADAGSRVKWTAYPAVSVPDWCFDDYGNLLWVLTETEKTESANPFRAERVVKYRTLWSYDESHKVTVTKIRLDAGPEGDGTAAAESDLVSQATLDIDQIPFVIVGKPSPLPWWFDDVEFIQCELLNLSSIHRDNLARNVFPQLVISSGTYESIQSHLMETMGSVDGERIMTIKKELIRGGDSPIIEAGDEKGTTRFISPSAADLTAIPDEIERLKKELYDTTGLSLFNKETRQTQTAESKQFDMLDTESTLKNRALIMQGAERKLVAMSAAIDPAFRVYDPVWPTSFDVVDSEKDIAAATMVDNLPGATPSMRKMALKTAVRVLQNTAGSDGGLAKDAMREIDAADFSEEGEVERAFGRTNRRPEGEGGEGSEGGEGAGNE